ncbi:MAG: UDP-glucose 4-epimerase GalE [Deltaproteobacteria bacterium]|nr:UDP-glucose 4-epimerase GalE [Deltaproteobacteria bacterium]
MDILVTGGAGYIGSHACLKLKEMGYNPVVYDNLVYGHKEAALDWDLVKGDLADIDKLRDTFKKYDFQSVMHFAAYAYVGESVKDPQKYYENNVGAGLNLLRVMFESGVKNFIFSSTCATYGNPETDRIDEKHRQRPINPYGESKLFFEKILKSYGEAYGLKSVCLRYFNAAGADSDGRIGESHNPETHLIPLVLKAIKGEIDGLSVFGDDYETPDGTCIRDYIHISDLAQAHMLALNRFKHDDLSSVFNLGNGRGFSVKEVIECAEKVTALKVPFKICGRREGDPAKLVAAAGLAKEVLGWKPEYADLERIIETAWKWEQNKKF